MILHKKLNYHSVLSFYQNLQTALGSLVQYSQRNILRLPVLTFVLLIFCCAATNHAQSTATESAKKKTNASVIKLWPGTPPGPKMAVRPEKDFTKDSDKLIAGRRIIKLGNVSSPEIHVFHPPEAKRNGSAVVICPGGGFHILAWDLEGTEVASWLNSLGITAIVLKYRVPTASQKPAWKSPTQDAQRAISLTRSKAKDWKINPDKVGILGFSAGGVTAVRTSLATVRHYAKIDPIDGFSCKPSCSILIYPGGVANQKLTGPLDDIKVTAQSPPAFLAHAFDDLLAVQNSLTYLNELKKAGVASELHVFDTGGHGFGLREVPHQPVTCWTKLCEIWLARNGWLTSVAK